MLGLAPAGQRDEAHRSAPGFAANRARDVVARHFGHADVEQHDVGPLLFGQLDGRAAVVRGEDLVTGGLEEEREAVGAVLAVVGDEDLRATRAAPARRDPRSRSASRGDGQRAA